MLASRERWLSREGGGVTQVLLQASHDPMQAPFPRSQHNTGTHPPTPALGKEMNGPVTRFSNLNGLNTPQPGAGQPSGSICILTTSQGDPDGLGTTLRNPTRGLGDFIL